MFSPAPAANQSPASASAALRSFTDMLEERALATDKLSRHAALQSAIDLVLTADGATARRHILRDLGPSGSAALARALGFDGRALWEIDRGRVAPPRDHALAASLMLMAMADGPPPSEGGVAFLGQILAQACPRTLSLGDVALAAAIAHARHPDDASAKGREMARLTGLFRDPRGRETITGEGLAPEVKRQTWAAILRDPNRDAVWLSAQPTHPWLSLESQAEAFAPRVQEFSSLRGDVAQTLLGRDLENTIGVALGVTPDAVVEDETASARATRERDAALGLHSYFARDEARGLVDPVAASVRALGGPTPEVLVLPIRWASLQAGSAETVLFRVRPPEGGDHRFVDSSGRTYDSIEDWRLHNTLPPGVVVFPAGGHLSPASSRERQRSGSNVDASAHASPSSGGARLSMDVTPSTVDTAGEVLLRVADGAATAGGLVAGVLLLAGPQGALLPFVAGGSAVWLSARAGERLVDRATHGETVDPMESADARAAWLELGAGLATAGTMGASAALIRSARMGLQGSLLMRVGASVARGASVGLDAAAAVDSAHALLTRWDQLDANTRVRLALAVGFWGVQAGVAWRGRAPRPLETDSLRHAIANSDGLPAAGTPRSTLGWSGDPTPTPPKGHEHLTTLQRGADALERLAPGARARIEAEFAPDPNLVKRQADLRDRQMALYREHGALVHRPEHTLDAAARAQQAKLRDQLDKLTSDIEAADTAARAQWERRFGSPARLQRARAEMRKILDGLKRVSRAEAEALAGKVYIHPSASRSGASEAQIREWLTDFYELAGDAVPPYQITIRFTKKGACFDPASGTVNVGAALEKEVLFHEMGHALERARPALAEAARAWRSARASHSGFGEETASLKELMPRGDFVGDELALQDHFLSPYTGRIYPGGPTEVISTGMESFVSVKDLEHLFRNDLEHFLLVVGGLQ